MFLNCHMKTPENIFEQHNISVYACARGIESLKSTVWTDSQKSIKLTTSSLWDFIISFILMMNLNDNTTQYRFSSSQMLYKTKMKNIMAVI